MTSDFKKAHLEYQIHLMDLHEKQIKRKANFRIIIGTILGGIVIYMLDKLFNTEIPAGNREVIYLLVGNATGAFFGTMINFYFGDSEGRVDVPVPPLKTNSVGDIKDDK